MRTRYDELIAIVRLADSLGWDVPTFDDFGARAEAMLSSGYALTP